MPTEDLNKEMTEAEREKINSYEDAFQKIYEETGVATMQVCIGLIRLLWFDDSSDFSGHS